jgi:hypothetical protein
MQFFRRLAKPIGHLMLVTIVSLSLHVPASRAALVPTEAVLPVTAASDERARVVAFLDRADVQQQLLAYGVDAQQAQARVDALTHEEVHALANQIDQLPAGASTAGDILLIAAVVFIVLIIFDLVGWTNIFPFTNKGSMRK